jgi:hypothetical protein
MWSFVLSKAHASFYIPDSSVWKFQLLQILTLCVTIHLSYWNDHSGYEVAFHYVVSSHFSDDWGDGDEWLERKKQERTSG